MLWLGWSALAAVAMETRRGDTVIVAPGEVVNDDLYVAARIVRIEGAVTGDAILVGQTVDVAGRIDGDLIAAGRDVIVSGQVWDDVRIAGSRITLGQTGWIGRDLIAAGGSVDLQPGSEVVADAAISGAQARLGGRIGGDLDATTSALSLAGPIGGGVRARIQGAGLGPLGAWFGFVPIASGLTVGSTAEIDGRLSYRAPVPARIEPGARLLGPVDEIVPPEPTAIGTAAVAARRFLGLLLVGAIAVLVAPRFVDRAADTVAHRVLPSLGVGAAAIVVWALAAVLLGFAVAALAWLVGVVGLGALSVVVVAAGALTGLGWAVTLVIAAHWLAQATVAIAVGEGMVRSRTAALILGLVLVALVGVIPVVGPVVGVAIALLGLGGMVLAAVRPRPPEPVPT